MKRLAIVPARGGSKRLPRKNLLPLGGKPLVQHTLDAVRRSEAFSTVLFSSDDDELIAVAEAVPGVTCERRDPELAGDAVKVIDLVKRIADRPESAGYDQIGLFLPTCPFRTATHIREGLGLLTRDDYAVVSVCEMGDPVQLSLTLDPETRVIDPEALLRPSPLVTGQTRSQDFQRFLRVNGGFYVAWLEPFRERDNFFQGRVKGYEMSRLHSVDVDEAIDLELANLLLEKGYVKLD